MSIFKNCKWIWINNEERPDEYADFYASFELADTAGVDLNISVDGNFEAYLNGQLCAFGACADYPHYKFYDRFSLDKYCKTGKNELKITVWHIGVPSSVYAAANAGLIFNVRQGERELVASSCDILSRLNPNYVSGRCKIVTMQLGPSYKYDATALNKAELCRSVEVEKTYNINPRNIENLRLLPRVNATVSDLGGRILVDLGRETVGFLDLELESDTEQELTVIYGEHLDECGRVPRIIGSRDFSYELVAKKGENKFLGAMRRLAGRYIEIEYSSPLRVRYAGLRPVVYPLDKIERRFENELHQRIYDTCAYTLECCMHEHYEDCPWREQALYSLDSRNQMLCGYIAFGEYKYARYNIILLAKSLHNGILKITSPTDTELPIPFFSLTFVQQVYEYVKFSGDRSILDEVMPVLDKIMATFAGRIDENGLIPAFPAPAWNFYEWTDGNDGSLRDNTLRYDLCLNAMFIYVISMYREIGGKILADTHLMRKKLNEVLFDNERGLYKNSSIDGCFSVIGNSLAVLSGAAGREIAERIVRERETLTDVSLSMNCYFYDALLSVDKSYKDYIMKDIEEKYSYMLSCGATTFWETIEGASAFSNAGSLCHGWSALPIYYFDVLNIK
ncbi:MAG: family 78 glycoside hydrolase catalytic domain [Clostridia bacterium]|nr:family 78 glycoside hydrolase catalytic domain [Clostridia bacterium]